MRIGVISDAPHLREPALSRLDWGVPMRLCCAASLFLSILLAACGAAAPVKVPAPVQAALPTPPDENYHHLNFDQKLDYLAALLQFRAGASLRADQASADQEMRRVLSAMSLDERGYTAAGVYVLLLRGPGRPPSNVERTPWEKDLLAVAQNDPVLTGAIARRNFVPFPLFQWNTDSINSFQDSLKRSLIFDATHGNAQACSALANLDYKTLSDQAFKRETCAGGDHLPLRLVPIGILDPPCDPEGPEQIVPSSHVEGVRRPSAKRA